MLKESAQALWDGYDVAMLDLDGVVYVGPDAVRGAPEHLAKAAAAGMHLAYVTNNAARPPSTVAAHLRELGIDAADTDVVNSAQAAARVLADRLAPGSAVYVIGGHGLFEALEERGLRPVQSRDADPQAVVSGYHPEILWRTVMTGAVLVREGLFWVASNTDMTVPTADGEAPGNGVLVETVARFASREPVVAGKPRPPLFEETLRRVGGQRPLVVGDRLDTDIEGAVNTGYDSLLVLTGVTDLAALVAAPVERRPSYISADLAGLSRPQPAPEVAGDTVLLDGWQARVADRALRVEPADEATDAAGEPGDPADGARVDSWWRVAAVAGWRHLDATGTPVDVSGVRPPGSVGA